MAKIYLLFKQSDLFYTREPVAASFFRNFIFEAHDVSKRPPPRARGYVVLASGIGDAYVAKGIDPARILVSGAGVTPEEFDISLSKTEARKKLSLPPSERIIGYTGTLKTFGKEKGVRTAIQALTNVPGAVLCLVGGEPHDIEEYKLLAEKEGVMDRTMFIGKVSHDQIPIYLKAFDVGLVPLPDTEYFRLYNSPLKLFEYMAAGVPIVASDLPSIREIVNDEQAFLVVPDDVLALARGIEKALKSPDEAMGRVLRAREEVGHRSWDARASSILTFASGIIQK
jgi:glycosyltransferase involved in cell wall biosynthesis